jgi:nucleotide-binding universal stress UspA family protein
MRRIVIGFDGSEHGEDALALGHTLVAAAEDPVVYVATVYAKHRAGIEEAAQIVQPPRRDAARAVLRHARELWPSLPAQAFLPVAAETTGTGLGRLAFDVEADAVVLGASAEHNAWREPVDSAKYKLLHDAPCAVALAPTAYAEGRRSHRLGRIGVAYDGSREARRALQLAAALARDPETTVVVVDVTAVSPDDDISEAALRGARASTSRWLAEAHVSLRETHDVELQQREGPVAEELIEACRDLDLLALGSRCHGHVWRALMPGSVSAKVVDHVDCPLVVVPRTAAEGPW